MIEPIIIRSKRKYLTIIIDKNANLIVRAPLRCTNKEIFDFLNKKSNWIHQKLALKKIAPKTLTPTTGEQISILGEIFEIKLNSIASKVYLKENNIFVPTTNSKQQLIKFLKDTAKSYLFKRTKEIAKLYNFNFNNLKITSAHTSWGSCTAKNNINFSYKLILCPKDIIDYIIVHELCHTKIKNHSVSFYNLVKSVLPNYKEANKWLKQNSNLVYLI